MVMIIRSGDPVQVEDQFLRTFSCGCGCIFRSNEYKSVGLGVITQCPNCGRGVALNMDYTEA